MYFLSAIPRAVIAIAGVLALTALSGCGPSATKLPYVFSTTSGEVAVGGDATVDVRLTQGDKPVEGAVIFETRFDMAPDGMGAMASDATLQNSPEPGTYRFTVKPTMAGRWELKLGAKVQGEADTVRGSVIVTAH